MFGAEGYIKTSRSKASEKGLDKILKAWKARQRNLNNGKVDRRTKEGLIREEM